jgi:hypothetical protein
LCLLSEAGVPVAAVRYHGTIHDFVMLNVITDDPSPRAAIEPTIRNTCSIFFSPYCILVLDIFTSSEGLIIPNYYHSTEISKIS